MSELYALMHRSNQIAANRVPSLATDEAHAEGSQAGRLTVYHR